MCVCVCAKEPVVVTLYSTRLFVVFRFLSSESKELCKSRYILPSLCKYTEPCRVFFFKRFSWPFLSMSLILSKILIWDIDTHTVAAAAQYSTLGTLQSIHTLQHTATHHSALQRTATECNNTRIVLRFAALECCTRFLTYTHTHTRTHSLTHSYISRHVYLCHFECLLTRCRYTHVHKRTLTHTHTHTRVIESAFCGHELLVGQ